MITIVDYDRNQKTIQIHENVDWRKFVLNDHSLYWWDLFQATAEEAACLTQYFHFHPLAVEDCLADVHHPKVDFYDSYIYVIVHGVDSESIDEAGFIPNEIDMFLNHQCLVVYHKKPSRSIQELLRRCKENAPIFEYGIDFVMYSLIDLLVRNYEPVLDDLADEIDATEEDVFSHPEPNVLKNIFRLKRVLIRLRKTLSPQREVANHLARNEYQLPTSSCRSEPNSATCTPR